MILLQWRNLLRRTARLNQFPVLKQFILMQIKPLKDMTQRAFREIPVNDAVWISTVT
jgi:hypothetical protein